VLDTNASRPVNSDAMKRVVDSKSIDYYSTRAARAGILVVFLAGLFLSVAVGWKAQGQVKSADGPDDVKLRERRGKQIYIQGTSASGKEILAYLGESSLEVPGSAMPCANCHGLNGQGKPEGGVDPSNLTWESLTKPYGLTHADGRRHPAYTDRGLELAITRGTDPAGNKLQNVMPRYQMTSRDMADLIAYLKRLGRDLDPGVYEDRIVIGTAVPTKGALAEMGQAVRAAINAFFDELNNQGGIYNRRFELKFTETGETPSATRANLERFLTDEQIFAMTGAFIAGAEKELVPLLAQKEVPLIGPLTLYPQISFPLNRQIFYLLSGTDGQFRALVDFAAKKPELKNPGVAVVYPRSEVNATLLESIRDQGKKQGWGALEGYDYVAGQFDAAIVPRLNQAKRSVVFFLGNSEEAITFLREAEKISWFPSIFLPSANAGAAIFAAPAGFDGKLYLSFPTSPADQTAEAITDFRALAEKYKLPTKHVAAQISAYSAAKILAEALKKAGKDLSREKLIQVLEGFYEYRTGLTPPISYGPNRRVGAMGAYVITVDLKTKQFVPAGGWIEIK
jgi:ABC-type branched-subunit amino acid transport system substrate-binding protein